MEKISAGMLLYHGSYTEVKNINLAACIAGKDFGQGFYLTSSYEQAKSFVRLSVKRNRLLGLADQQQNYGFVNIYEVVSTAPIRDYYFATANLEWLHFVAGNRDKTLFQTELQQMQQYNVIAGKIANDRTAATLQAYLDGIYGEPGDEQADQRAIEILLPNRLADQYCFKNEDAVHALQFIRSERVAVNGK